jgi:sporulation protein YlmC with PRC-barrel domain
MKKLFAAASLIALLAVPAVAQDTTPPKTPAAQELKSDATVALDGEISANDLLNKSVKNAANEDVGDINDVRIDNSGNVAAVIVGVGGFLGLGEKNVALTFDQIKIARDSDGKLVVTADVTKESLQAAPEYKKPENRS